MDTVGAARNPGSIAPFEGDVMGNIEMYPSSAVAQTHVPGSAARINSLQQPPLATNQLNHQPSRHHRTSSIFQSSLLDNNGQISFKGGPDVDVSVNMVSESNTRHQQQSSGQGRSAQQEQSNLTRTCTSTATSSDMMTDDPAPVPAPVAKADPVPPGKNDTRLSENTTNDAKAAGAKEPHADDVGGNSAVRKVR